MSEVLLQTKLHIPSPLPFLVPRPQLLQKLKAGLPGRLTLVSAPAGYGKTTLVAHWLLNLEGEAWHPAPEHTPISLADQESAAAQAGPQSPATAWLSLDESDNDPARFLAYLLAALQTAAPQVGLDAQALLQSPQPPLQEAYVTLLNDVAAHDTPLILALDDYHLVTTALVHRQVSFLLEYAPDHFHLILLTRADPPLPLSRLRARGQLNEIRQEDLRFSSLEAGDFFRKLGTPNLSPGQVAALETRTEGWVAGLQMAALSLQGHQDVDAFIRSFAGSHRYLMDYLADEVLEKQPARVRHFLLYTAILDRLCAPLCDAILDAKNATADTQSPTYPGDPGQPQSQQLLEQLQASNLFLIPLDEHRQWYRYHHLFRTFLQTRLLRKQPGNLSVLHRRAAIWYEEEGLVEEAVRHWLAADQTARAADLIQTVARSMLTRGQGETVRRWLDALPVDLVRARPHLSFAQAIALTFVRDVEGIESHLENVERAVHTDGGKELAQGEQEQLLGGVATYRAMVALWREDLVQARRLCHQALGYLEEKETYLRGVALLLLGMTRRQHNDLQEATNAYLQALEVGQNTGDVMLGNTAAINLAQVYVIQGRLRAAAGIYRQALALATDKQGRPLPLASGALVGLAQISRERNELDEAERYLAKAIPLARRAGLQEILLEATTTQALTKWAQGEWEDALARLARAEEMAHRYERQDLLPRLGALGAKISLAQSRLDTAVRWAQEYELHLQNEPDPWNEGPTLVLIQVIIARATRQEVDFDTLKQSITLLNRLQERAEEEGRLGSLMAILTMQALAHEAQGDKLGAVAALNRALSLAEPEGYVRQFADAGPQITRLLQRAAGMGRRSNVAYIGRLLAACRDVPPAPSTPPGVEPLLQPLTERELEVMHLIAAGLSNREIADTLVIALGTVKRHINHIYRKLGVHSRTQAVARSRDLGLVS